MKVDNPLKTLQNFAHRYNVNVEERQHTLKDIADEIDCGCK